MLTRNLLLECWPPLKNNKIILFRGGFIIMQPTLGSQEFNEYALQIHTVQVRNSHVLALIISWPLTSQKT